jgi:hypothetical protein
MMIDLQLASSLPLVHRIRDLFQFSYKDPSRRPAHPGRLEFLVLRQALAALTRPSLN